MRLSRKLTTALAGGILVVMAAYAAVLIHNEVTLFRADIKKNARVGRALKATIEDVWRVQGEERARMLVEEADDENEGLGVRIVRLGVGAGAAGSSAGLDADETASLRRGELLRLVRGTETGDQRRYTFFLLDVPGDGDHALELFESLHDRLTFIRMNRIGVVVAAIAVTAVCTLIVMSVASHFVSRPIRLLCEQARRVGSGDFSQRLALPQRDEIGELARELNTMCDLIADGNRRVAEEADARIAALEQMRHTDRLATVGKLASGIAHQLGTPLNVVAIRAKMIGESASTEALRQHAHVIVEQAERMTGIVRRLLDFSRRRTVSRGRLDLGRVVARTVELIGSVAGRRGVQITSDLPENAISVEIDEGQLQQALANIMLNGVQAMESGGTLTVRVGVRSAARPDDQAASAQAFVTVEDHGPGIDAEHREELFEPFFTTKVPGEGTGLGLSVAHDIVQDHDGWIVVDSTPGQGASFTVFLPLADAAVEKAS